MSATSRRLRVRWAVLLALIVMFTPFAARGEVRSTRDGKREITVADAIEMTTIGAPDYFGGESSKGFVAHFSPNREKFVVVLRRGNLARNTNDFSLLLYKTPYVFHAAKPDLLLQMSSASNRDAIGEIRWLGDNDTVVFLGGNSDSASQVYTLNVNTKLLQEVTNHPTTVTDYDTSSDGQRILFAAAPPVSKATAADQERLSGVVIKEQWLADLLTNNLGNPPGDGELFLQHEEKRAVRIPMVDRIHRNGSISISPDGRYALVGTWVRDVPVEWAGYREKHLHAIVISHKKGELALLSRYQLLDTSTGSLAPLINAPMSDLRQFVWAGDSHAVSLKTYLPLDVVDSGETEMRSQYERPVEVKLPSRELRTITEEEFREKTTKRVSRYPDIDVTLEEGVNKPPGIYVSDSKTHRKALLLDLNPQLSELDVGTVESISWRATDGKERTGGLFLPPHYKVGEGYPLVIQTHGFWRDRFSMDGSPEWSSAFAARMLAAKRIVVLQAAGILVSGGPDEGPSFMATIEGAIEYLGQRGLINRNRVGISGFSRTVYEAGYMLTHSRHRFSAAVLVDGITGGYMDYLAWGDNSEAALNGGPPFGDGLKLWLTNSPGFNLDKVNSPVRVVALGTASVLEMWEWFAGLRLQNKPVDFIAIPEGSHLLQKPWDRRLAMQGIVDWFCFWLQGYEDPDQAKTEQYRRWEQLCDMQVTQNPNQPAFCVRSKPH